MIITLVLITQVAFGQLDTLKTMLPVRIDTLQMLTSKIDSIQVAAQGRIDSVAQSYQSLTDQIQDLGSGYQKRIDSLINLNQSPEKYTHKIDSLNGVLNKNKQIAETKIQSIKEQAEAQLSKLPVLQNKVSHLTDALDKLKVPSLSADMKLNTPNIKLGLKFPVPPKLDLPEVKGLKPPSLNILDEVGKVKSIVGDVTKYAGALNQVTKGIEEVKSADYVAKAEEEIQKQLLEMDNMKVLQGQVSSIDAFEAQAKQAAESVKNPEVVVEKAKEEFVDHFAGKEEMIKKDLEEIGKIQLKYRDVADSRFIPKRPPNEMKGKPFLERMIPGIDFQLFPVPEFSANVSPFLGYRLTGRLSSGVAGYRRVAYIKKNESVKMIDNFGFRVFGTFRVFKGMSAYGDIERFKNMVDPVNHSLVNPAYSDAWRWKINLGFQERYKLRGGLHCRVLYMYNLMQLKEFPKISGSTIRLGFDYQIKVKQKKK